MTRFWALLPCVLAGALAAQSFEEEFRRGLLALSANDLSQARQSLESASRLQPDNSMVWAALAQAYLRGKEAALAREAADRASRLAPPDSPVRHALAMFYSETGDFQKAADAERRYASSPGSDPESAARAADLSLRAGEAALAVVWAETALHRADTARAHHLLGQAYAAVNRPNDAERELRAAVDRDPQLEAYAFDLGQVQLRRGDFAGAAATLKKACRSFPGSAQIQLAYGVAAYGQRRFDLAIDAFLRVIRIDPSIEQPYLFLSRLLDQAGDRLPQVVAAYAAWERMTPDGYLPVCLHAKALSAASGDSPVIEGKLRRSIQLNGQYWESHYELGALLMNQRKWPEAAAELSRAIALNPKHPPAHFQLARVYDKLGKAELAQAERAEHQRLTAAETSAGQAVPLAIPTPAGKDKPLP